MANDYLSQIAAMRAERAGRAQREELKSIVENHEAMIRARDQAAAEGNIEDLEYYDDEAIHYEREYAKVAPAPQGPQFTAEDQRWFNARSDLNTPLNQARFGQFEKYMEMNREYNKTAHPDEQRAVFERGTPQYREALETFYSPGFFDKDGKVIEGTEGTIVPQNYQPMPTPTTS